MIAPLAALLLLLALPTVAGARKPVDIQLEKPVLTMHVDSRVVIAKDGTIAEYTPSAKLPPSIAERFHAMVRGLTFEPVRVNGEPVNAGTRLRATLAAEQLENGNYKVWVDNITFPPDPRDEADADLASDRRVRLGVRSKRRADYPASMLHHGVAVRVLAYIRADLEGNIVDVQPVQSAVLNRVGDEREMAKVIAVFEAQTVRALRGWKLQVDVPPGVSPTPWELSAGVVYTYQIVGDTPDRAGRWTLETRTARRQPMWLDPSSGGLVSGVSDVDDSGLVPANGAIRLKTPVAGLAL